MKVGRSVPPAAAPLCWKDLWHGLVGASSPVRTLRAREDELRQEFDVPYVFLVSSGAAALVLTLMALRSLSSKEEVVIPAYTCFSVPAAVLKAGLRPTLCDIDSATFDFDSALLEQAVNGNTLCVIAHHLFGVPSNIDRTRALCHARGAFVIEDAAQAMGASNRGRKLGTIGDVGIFSLGRGKNITCGSGGVIVTRSSQIAGAIAERYRGVSPSGPLETIADVARVILMTTFIRPRLYWIPAALPFLRLGETVFPTDIPLRRLTGFKAGLLRHWQERLRQSNRIRAATSSYFRRRMALKLGEAGAHPYLRLPILAATPKEKQRLFAHSRAQGLGLSVAYPTPISEIPAVRRAINGQQFPAAQKVAATLLTVPTHEWLTRADKQAITALWRDADTA